MDYKYIEQLLERYWECQTTLEEEAILRKFFAQDDIPASLLPYRDLFLAEEGMANEHLSEDFDEKLMARIGETEQKPKAKVVEMRWAQRLAPLYRAAAIVAIVLSIGMAAQQGFESTKGSEQPHLTAAESEGDTLQLFTDMPEALPKAEAVLTSTTADSLIVK